MGSSLQFHARNFAVGKDLESTFRDVAYIREWRVLAFTPQSALVLTTVPLPRLGTSDSGGGGANTRQATASWLCRVYVGDLFMARIIFAGAAAHAQPSSIVPGLCRSG